MNMSKIAIVVPVYNVEKYLAECLQSVLDQTCRDWECFVVDDGSTDGSGMIVDRFAVQDTRFRVFHKKNGGVSSARNTALNVIFNETDRFAYLYFLDSDDRIPQNFLAEMSHAIGKEHTDMAMCPYIPFDRRGPTRDALSSRTVLNASEVANAYLTGSQHHYGKLPGSKFFVLDRVTGMYFNENTKTAEDQEWIINVLPRIRSCVTVPTTHYQYRLRASSLSHSNRVLQDYDTFSRVLKTTYECFSPLTQPLIQARFIESLYDLIKEDIYCNVTPDRIRKRIADGIQLAQETFRHPISDKKNRSRFARLKHWPFFLLMWYMGHRSRKSVEKTLAKSKDYFD